MLPKSQSRLMVTDMTGAIDTSGNGLTILAIKLPTPNRENHTLTSSFLMHQLDSMKKNVIPVHNGSPALASLIKAGQICVLCEIISPILPTACPCPAYKFNSFHLSAFFQVSLGQSVPTQILILHLLQKTTCGD